jgi:hypothetical protein
MKGLLVVLSGVGVGAGLMYLLDPDRGNRRRALIRDKAVSLNNKTQRAIGNTVQDLRNRTKGLLHETKSALSSENQGTGQQTA